MQCAPDCYELFQSSFGLTMAFPNATISATASIGSTLLPRSCPAACQLAKSLHGPFENVVFGLYLFR